MKKNKTWHICADWSPRYVIRGYKVQKVKKYSVILAALLMLIGCTHQADGNAEEITIFEKYSCKYKEGTFAERLEALHQENPNSYLTDDHINYYEMGEFQIIEYWFNTETYTVKRPLEIKELGKNKSFVELDYINRYADFGYGQDTCRINMDTLLITDGLNDDPSDEYSCHNLKYGYIVSALDDVEWMNTWYWTKFVDCSSEIETEDLSKLNEYIISDLKKGNIK